MGTEAILDMNSILFGRTIRGIIEGDSIPDISIPQLIELYGRGRFPFDRLIAFYGRDQINTATEGSVKGRAITPVLRMPG
jgi:aryl-alcohol dehydrogenase